MKRCCFRTLGAALAVLAVCAGATRGDVQMGPVVVFVDFGLFDYDQVTDGIYGSITWSGGETDTTLQIWHGWTGGWEMLADGVDSTLGDLRWASTGGSWAPGGTHYFTAWARDADGNWSYVPPHGPVTVLPPWQSFDFSDLGGGFGALGERDYDLDAEVNVGQQYDIHWKSRGPNELVQLWAGSADGWWVLGEIPVAPTQTPIQTTGSYVWDTAGVEPGVYAITAWVKSVDDPKYGPGGWVHAAAAGRVVVTQPGMFVTVPEPASATILIAALVGLAVKRRRLRG